MKKKPAVANSFLKRELEINRGKNIFSREFEDTILSVRISEKLMTELKGIDLNFKNQLLNDIVDNVIKELCLVNQFYHFGLNEKKELKFIYASLLDKLVENEKRLEEQIQIIKSSHLNNLRSWLRKTNPFAEELYSADKAFVERTPCDEYSAEFQMMLFGLSTKNIKLPVLDIGCGENFHLVKFFRQNKIWAYGIDRYKTSAPGIVESDWLSHDYGVAKWGTITSNMAFSNHFNHHHLRKDGHYEEYARCYMRILNSLQKGGAFHYAPDIPFIEEFLDPSQYQVTHVELQNTTFRATKVEKL